MTTNVLSRSFHWGIFISLLVVPSVASATLPYGPLAGGIPGGLGPGLAPASLVPGKEYSHDFDHTTLGGGGIADPQQVIAWDGSGGTADGYYATGSEIFVMDATLGPGGTTFLSHGGHLWDHEYALSSLVITPNLTDGGRAVIDINAIEAISATVVPEPSAVVLVAMAGIGATAFARRRGASRPH